MAQRCGLGEVRDFLFGIEYEFPGARLASPDALHCFVSKRYAPGYIGWLAQNPGGIQAGLALRHDPAKTGIPDIDGFLLHAGQAGGGADVFPHAQILKPDRNKPAIVAARLYAVSTSPLGACANQSGAANSSLASF